jgi:hypothetical protein
MHALSSKQLAGFPASSGTAVQIIPRPDGSAGPTADDACRPPGRRQLRRVAEAPRPARLTLRPSRPIAPALRALARNGAWMRRDTSAATGPLPDPPLYERLIGDGIAAADIRHGAVDHVTARRLAIWLASQPEQPDFARGLARFTRTGAITQVLKMQLRYRARSATYPHRPQAARLLEYCLSRGDDLGPVGPDFGSACDQIDQADAMLAGLRDRARQGIGPPGQAWPDADGQQILALASQNSETRTVSLVLDATTANIAMFAIAAYAGDREAHVREVEQFGEKLPEGSYGRRNRQAIAARETRVAARLRAVERAYRTAIERDAVTSPEASTRKPSMTVHSAHQIANREMELE